MTRRRLAVVVALALGSLAPSHPEHAPPACSEVEGASAEQYLSGEACPPGGFPYSPQVVVTPAGPRALDPFTDGCSNVRSRGRTFDFFAACAAHDYAYDLLRFGVGIARADTDMLFRHDMLADCELRAHREQRLCVPRAEKYAAGVAVWTLIEGPVPSGPVLAG